MTLEIKNIRSRYFIYLFLTMFGCGVPKSEVETSAKSLYQYEKVEFDRINNLLANTYSKTNHRVILHAIERPPIALFISYVDSYGNQADDTFPPISRQLDENSKIKIANFIIKHELRNIVVKPKQSVGYLLNTKDKKFDNYTMYFPIKYNSFSDSLFCDSTFYVK